MKGKRKIKNSFLILTSIIFLIACINYNVFAASQNGKEVNTSNNDILEINKSAQAVNNNRPSQLNDRSYKISLNARACSAALKDTRPKDIILVLDTSGSMLVPATGSIKPIDSLKDSVKNFSNKILKNSKNQISLITFSNEYKQINNIKYLNNDGILYTGEVNYKGKIQTIYINKYLSSNSSGYTDYENYYGYMMIGNKKKGVSIQRIINSEDNSDNYYLIMGNDEDSSLLQGFTNNSNLIDSKIDTIQAGGGTDTQSALNKVRKQLKVSRNDGRERYVIVFTDGMPNMLVDFSDYDWNNMSDAEKKQLESLKIKNIDDYYVYKTIETFKNIENSNKDVNFISLGFESRDSEAFNGETYGPENFLRSIQNYNDKIQPGCNGVIYIKNPNDIQGIYDEIANKILNNVTEDAIITDTVPDGFEIVNGSEEPKGAIIKNNTITWSKQEIGKENMTYTFKIKAKDTNFGTENLISEKNVTENPKLDITNSKDMNTNTNATISYTYNLDNSKHEQTFNVPHVSVPNDASLDLSSNKTYYYGDKIKLKDLIKYLNIKYGPEDGYTYIWSDNHGHSITLNNQKKNAKVGNTFDKNSKGDDSITLTEDTTFTLEIIKENKYDKDGTSKLDLKDSVNIKVINPKVTIIKKVDGEGDSNNVFSFKVTGNNNTWNLDVNENKPFTLTNLTKGTYTLSEIEAQGYKLESIKVNGKEISLNKPTFSISDDNYNIQIEILNKKLNKSIYYNDTETIKNKF
ncbi:Mg-chelatase subunit ChlD [Clostridium moniliforme]|uniref:Mg-chelatase subunit ChlD n=1 Tax=Clostridium moniliforme TaxID=39489 RepID=A0ABS4F3D8_9CLOT|nr:VWA domain-containing protein [Clostridium moniliforme]MBP1890612.1 Mg-chelatase subunit ChlD [Clostridium moniliforme]